MLSKIKTSGDGFVTPVHIKTLDLHQMICQQLKLYMSLLNEHGVAGVFNYVFFDTTSHFIQELD